MKNLKLSLRIGLGFGVLIAITLILGIMASWNMNTVGRQSIELAQQFIPETTVAGDVEKLSLETMYGVRGYALSQNEKYLKEGLASLAKVKKALDDGKSLANKYPNLVKLREGVAGAEEKIKEYERLINETVSSQKAIADIRQRANAAAKKFMDNCSAYEDIQRASFDKEIKSSEKQAKLLERYQKVNEINDVIEAGHNVRIANYKTQATDNIQFVQDGMKSFEIIFKDLDEMKAATHQEENLRLLKEAQAGAEEYRTTISDYIKTWQQLEDVNKKANDVAHEVLKLAAETSQGGTNETITRADKTVAAMSSASIIMNVGLVLAVILGIIIATLIARGIINPIRQAVGLANAIAAGDLTKRLNLDRQDEIGEMSRSLDQSCDQLATLIKQIQDNAKALASQSEELSAVSSTLVANSEEMTTQANNVAGATEQMSSNINTMASAAEEMSVNISTVSSAAEQMSQNMNTVASAIEEMTMSISDVARSAEDGAKIANKATKMSSNATTTMNTLGTAAQAIGKVTEVIKRIAEQTNLLALNATIEAASAGDAGKGFAVVANEIKELANQSAQAAEDIANKIEGVQLNTQEAVKVIKEVSNIITTISESVDLISSSVEQQTKAANEISSNVSQAASGVNDIAGSIAEVAKGANDMSQNVGEAARGVHEASANIHGVSYAAADSNTSARQINAAASELAKVAGHLEVIVKKFQV
ncbi:MAG: methyl-accepting chemotaxis protein [Deltaproteobacteria bacterium]|nr:methyl-accepting chemotaxis protein [Deltaproteobacteria bacterium]